MRTRAVKVTASVILALCLLVVSQSPAASQRPAVHEMDEMVAERTGLAPFQVDALGDRGYVYSEIVRMSLEEVDAILTRDMNPSERARYYAGVEEYRARMTPFEPAGPPGYTLVVVVPDRGGVFKWFHPRAETTESTIDGIVEDARAGAGTIFGCSPDRRELWCSFALWGEWGEVPGFEHHVHEGIDLRNQASPTASVYSPISGIVCRSSRRGGCVSIYNSALEITMSFQHLDEVDSMGKLAEGRSVEAGQFLGKQNPLDDHIHVQVCAHHSCRVIHSSSDQEMNLTCVRPYEYIK